MSQLVLTRSVFRAKKELFLQSCERKRYVFYHTEYPMIQRRVTGVALDALLFIVRMQFRDAMEGVASLAYR